MTCGATHTITGGSTLTCTFEPGHELPHGVNQPGLPPFVVWPVGWTDAHDAERAERYQWRKGHVRRAYRTLAMWKAGR